MWNNEDDEYSHFSGVGREPKYFYRVYESVNTFEKGKHYSNVTDFRIGSLEKCRAEAISFYNERMQGFESGKAKFFLPFEISVIILLLLLIHSCKKDKNDESPVITTAEITNITATSAVGGGNLKSAGDYSIITKGVCWSTSPGVRMDSHRHGMARVQGFSQVI